MHRWARRLWTTAGATACGVVLSLLATAVPTQAASAAVPTTARTRATAAVDAMMGFYDQETGRWQPESPWWQSGNALQALLDYMAKTGSRKYMSEVKNTIAVQRAPLEWWPQGGGEFRADSTDDTGWWALAMTRMYDLTRDQKYLDIAELDEAYMRDYWDDTCGGGIWWDIPAKSYKNAISIELYIKLAASLHNRIPGDKVYLAHALEAWQWFKDSGMINSDHLVNDGLTTWTYNQGVVLGGLAELYKATGDKSLLTDARDIADAVIASPSLTQNGTLTEPCQAAGDCNSDQAAFKGIFARNLGELDALLTSHPYRSYLRAQASSAYTNSRNSSHQYGLSWAGPFDQATIGRQESAVSLLTSVL
jgi:predicted alpha-1,6-mannanase (GH76 family)